MRLDSHDNTAKDHRRARELRNNASPIENKFWCVLREAAKAAGLKFRRQQPIHPYIADFACMSAKLLIELDGDTHTESTTYDQKRDAHLKEAGFTVLRFSNDDVVQNAEGVAMRIIEHALMLRPPLPRLCYKCSTGTLVNVPAPLKGEGSPSTTSSVSLEGSLG